MYNTILFDLDGTLTDPYIGITNGIIHALERMDMEVPPREELKSFIGPPLLDEFQRKFGLNEEKAQQAAAFYREYYFEKGWCENRLIDGTTELLRELRDSGRRLCLATSKPDVMAVKILEHFGIAEYFELVGASTLDGTRRTKTDVLRYVLENTHAAPEDCVLVGDRMHDIIGAHEVGIKCIAVLVGYGDREEFSEYGADYVAQTLADVKKFI